MVSKLQIIHKNPQSRPEGGINPPTIRTFKSIKRSKKLSVKGKPLRSGRAKSTSALLPRARSRSESESRSKSSSVLREESSERQWMHEPGIEEDERENEESPWGRNRRTVPEGIGFRRMSNTPKAEPVFTPKAPKRGLKMQKEAPASVYAMKGPKEERPEGRVSAGKDAQSKSREGVPATSVTEATEAPSAGGAIQQRPPVLSDNVQSNYSRKWRKRILHRSGEGGNAVNFTSAQGRYIRYFEGEVAKWQVKLQEAIAKIPEDHSLIKHCERRLDFHQGKANEAKTTWPDGPTHSQERIAILTEALAGYKCQDDITNLSAAIEYYKDGTLHDNMTKWTVLYNGKVVDTINSIDELRWSLRDPLYKKIYGPKGSIWVEPPAGYISNRKPKITNPELISGGHWAIAQNMRLPWYEDKSCEFQFLLDSGATHCNLYEMDFVDLGLVKEDCPHVCRLPCAIAGNRIILEDYYPVFINYLDPETKEPLTHPHDGIASMSDNPEVSYKEPIEDGRLSGLDFWTFNYVASEPVTGDMYYGAEIEDTKGVREGISVGSTYTPRAWYTVDSDGEVSEDIPQLQEPPRLLNPEGERYNIGEPYNHQYGDIERTPPAHFEYRPLHKEHQPTPDSIRKDRRWYWEKGVAYRDDRLAMRYKHATDWTPSHKDEIDNQTIWRNPWQYKSPEERYLKPQDHRGTPKNPKGVRYWQKGFIVAAKETGLVRNPKILQALKDQVRKQKAAKLAPPAAPPTPKPAPVTPEKSSSENEDEGGTDEDEDEDDHPVIINATPPKKPNYKPTSKSTPKPTRNPPKTSNSTSHTKILKPKPKYRPKPKPKPKPAPISTHRRTPISPQTTLISTPYVTTESPSKYHVPLIYPLPSKPSTTTTTTTEKRKKLEPATPPSKKRKVSSIVQAAGTRRRGAVAAAAGVVVTVPPTPQTPLVKKKKRKKSSEL